LCFVAWTLSVYPCGVTHVVPAQRLSALSELRRADLILSELEQRPCAHCSVRLAVDKLVDVTDLAPLSGPICAHCERDLVAELRDNDTSPPDHEADAATRGELRPEALALLGLDKGEL